MAWAKPEYTREKVNAAGKTLISGPTQKLSMDEAFLIINNWRTSHNFPLNTFQARLRRLSKEIDPNSIVAQRIKRISSIQHKLERFEAMKLSQIQDIGGCRAILNNVTDVDSLVQIYLYKESRGVKHKIATEDDYIAKPKDSGYRGVHLVYKYQSDKSQDYKDMKIEIQIRTILQHAWATAVETVGTFIKQSLKSSQGEEDWLRFFALMGSAMAMREERPTIPNTPTTFRELQKDIIALEDKLDVEGHLSTFRDSLSVFDEDRLTSDAHYYLLELDVTSRRVLIKGYKQNELLKASDEYLSLERRIVGSNTDAVLVSADSLEKLRLAYPNYYLDTDLFLEAVKEVTTTRKKS